MVTAAWRSRAPTAGGSICAQGGGNRLWPGRDGRLVMAWTCAARRRWGGRSGLLPRQRDGRDGTGRVASWLFVECWRRALYGLGALRRRRSRVATATRGGREAARRVAASLGSTCVPSRGSLCVLAHGGDRDVVAGIWRRRRRGDTGSGIAGIPRRGIAADAARGSRGAPLQLPAAEPRRTGVYGPRCRESTALAGRTARHGRDVRGYCVASERGP